MSDSSASTSADIVLQVNTAPWLGWLHATPLQGVVGVTPFRLTAGGWADAESDYPLQYEFGASGANNVDAPLHAASLMVPLHTSRLLPVGLGLSSATALYVRVYDAFGASTRAYRNATGHAVAVRVQAPAVAPLPDDALASGFPVTAGGSLTELTATMLIGDISSRARLVASLINDPCEAIDCGLRGSCVNGRCVCNEGWTGSTCGTEEDVDGVWGDWSPWSACSRACGSGVTVRSRECVGRRGTGATCLSRVLDLGPVSETLSCNTHLCLPGLQVHGGYSEWSLWTTCSSSCPPDRGGTFPGVRSRSRTCSNPVPAGTLAMDCSILGEPAETEGCNTEPCPAPLLDCPGAVHDATTFALTSECSGHGTCLRSHMGCTTDSATCVATCSCDAGWATPSCAVQNSAVVAQATVRGQLLTVLGDAVTRLGGSASTSDQVTLLAALAAVVSRPAVVGLSLQLQALDLVQRALALSTSGASSGIPQPLDAVAGWYAADCIVQTLQAAMLAAPSASIADSASAQAAVVAAASSLSFALVSAVPDTLARSVVHPSVVITAARRWARTLGLLTFADGNTVTFPSVLCDTMLGGATCGADGAALLVEAVEWQRNPFALTAPAQAQPALFKTSVAEVNVRHVNGKKCSDQLPQSRV